MDALVEHAADAVAAGGETVRIGGVGLKVRDLAATRSFYRDVIGLEVLATGPDRALLGAGGVGFVELLHDPQAQPDDPRAAGLFHTAFLLPSRVDLADWLAHAAETGVQLDGASDHAVSEAIYLSDPEGNGVEIYADRPRAAWRWQDGQVVMGTDRLDAAALLATRSRGLWRGAAEGTRIGHVHLRVGDVGQAIRFWTQEIGLDLVRNLGSAAFLSSGGYHHHIAANVWQSPAAGIRDPGRAGLAYVRLDTAPAATLADPWGTEIRRSTLPLNA